MANQLILGRALDANGYIAPGAKATVFADGTSTLITVYSDVAGTIAATNPIIADADGFWPQRYVAEDAKVVVTDANDVALYTLDPAPTAQGTGAAASQVSFTPSVNVPRSDVQSAVDYLGAQLISGFSTFGLGITGNATLLANLDATATASGVYRFDGTTTGTFPTGVTAGDTGAVELWRQAGATAMMELHHATSNRVFRRRLTSSVWGAWREVINVNQATAEGDVVYRGASDWVRLPKGTAGQILQMNAGATAPEWTSTPSIRVSANFQGTTLAGTYSRTGTTVTVTMTSHGMTTGQFVTLDFTTGGGTDGYYQVTVVDANTFTVVDTVSGATSGNVTRLIRTRRQTGVSFISRVSTGVYTVTMSLTAPNAVFEYFASTDGGTTTAAQTGQSTTTFSIATRDPAGTLVDVNSIHVMAIW